MAQAKKKEVIPPEAAPGEYGALSWDEWQALPEDVRRRRAQRGYEKFLELKGKVHLDLNIDELRGRNRR